MEKIEFEGQIFYVVGNKFVDSSFCAVDKNTNEKLCELFFKNTNLSNFSKEQLLKFITEQKQAEQFSMVKNACVIGLEKFSADENFVKQILPTFASTLRHLGQPRLALDAIQKHTDLCNCSSPALWISAAAAACDLFEFKDAIMFLKLAKQEKRGHNFEEDSEFSAVENRIKKALDVDEI